MFRNAGGPGPGPQRGGQARLGGDGAAVVTLDEEQAKAAVEAAPAGSDALAIETQALRKRFDEHEVLTGVDLNVPKGATSVVLGPSGTGKSVLIKHIIGLLQPDAGDVLVHGQSVPNLTDDELFEMRKKFGLLFQDGALFGSMNVFDNTAFPLRQHTDKGEEEIGEIVTGRLRE